MHLMATFLVVYVQCKWLRFADLSSKKKEYDTFGLINFCLLYSL